MTWFVIKASEFVVVCVERKHGQSALINDDADKTDCMKNKLNINVRMIQLLF